MIKIKIKTDETARKKLVNALGLMKGMKIYHLGQEIVNDAQRMAFYNGIVDYQRTKDTSVVHDMLKWRVKPVDIETFVFHEFYLGLPKDEIYPPLVQELIEMNSGKYIEIVLTGAIGTGKTTLALLCTAYQLYVLSCYANPHNHFGIDRSSEILFVFQNISADLAKKVDFARFKAMLEKSHYFTRVWPFDKHIQSELKFPNRVILRPISGSDKAAIGQNVFGGIMDEVNFMAMVEKSKQSHDGGEYDQARANYNTLSKRRQSRFMNQGETPGLLCLVSSRNYPGQLTDDREEEAQKQIELTGKSTIYVYDRRIWEINPGKFTDQRFRMYLGDGIHKPQILGDDEDPPEGQHDLVLEIPEEYRSDFEKDPYGSIRDIAGKSTQARHPYFTNVEAVNSCFGKVASILNGDHTDFLTKQLGVLKSKIQDKDKKRAIHIDLGLTSDSAGIACGYIDRFETVNRGDSVEVLPVVKYDFVLEVKPPQGGEILFWKVRELIYTLSKLGLNIVWVSMDSYQSKDTEQMLRQKGYITGQVSMDTSMLPYDLLKSAFADSRVSLPLHKKTQGEILSLERDAKRKKIDHPPHSSKDCSDAVAGVNYVLTTRRILWIEHKVSPQQIPLYLTQMIDKENKREKRAETNK